MPNSGLHLEAGGDQGQSFFSRLKRFTSKDLMHMHANKNVLFLPLFVVVYASLCRMLKILLNSKSWVRSKSKTRLYILSSGCSTEPIQFTDKGHNFPFVMYAELDVSHRHRGRLIGFGTISYLLLSGANAQRQWKYGYWLVCTGTETAFNVHTVMVSPSNNKNQWQKTLTAALIAITFQCAGLCIRGS